MFYNYFKSALRNIYKNKLQAFISIFGLTVGIGVSIIIALFVQDEFSYDKYHDNADRIYRVANNWKSGDNTTPWARTSTPLAPALEAEYAEIMEAVRVRKNPRTDLLAYNEDKFYENSLYFADADVFKIFSFGLEVGNPETALKDKYSIVLTRRMAEKYFGNDNPIGKVLKYNNTYDLKVTGILEEVPANSHFHFDFLADFETVKEVLGERRTTNWFWFDLQTYILVNEGTNPTLLEEKIGELMGRKLPEEHAPKFNYFLQPVTDIHLNSDLRDELEVNSSESTSYILITTAVFILLMACINFINLTTANFTKRSLEIGIRKVFGAHRTQLTKQYLFEAVLLTFGSFVLALGLTMLALPTFNQLADKSVLLFSQANISLFVIMTIAVLITGLIAGSYPALYLSGLRPINALKGSMIKTKSAFSLRSILVTLQISISLILIVATLIVARQLEFVRGAEMGFDKDFTIVIPIKDRSKNDGHEAVTNAMKESAFVKEVTYTSTIPGSNNTLSFDYQVEGTDLPSQRVSSILTDNNFTSAFGIDVKDKIPTDLDQLEDTIHHVFVNQAFVDAFSLENPVGSFVNGGNRNKIIGVTNDFNTKSLHNGIDPVIISYEPRWYRFVAVKIDGQNYQSAIDHLDKVWQQFYAGFPVEYSFLDNSLAKFYESEERLNTIFGFFSMVAIVIAGLGLMSLTIFTINRKMKEIGIRKVLGSPVRSIIYLFSKDLMILIAIASLIAIPVGYYLMNEWLNSFTFRINIGVELFIGAILIMTISILLFVGLQIFRASRVNPAKILKYE
ncbi:MAG: FtsX-like permease family protein [Roseivirga sp.]|nr:FtsX-like permease family protein [Roseivirga sp.]